MFDNGKRTASHDTPAIADRECEEKHAFLFDRFSECQRTVSARCERTDPTASRSEQA